MSAASSLPENSWDPAWEEVFRNSEWGKYPPEHVIRFVARNFYGVPKRKEIRLLDLGCGPGACTWYMAREGFSVSGIDGSETAIRRARKRLADEGLDADLRLGDFVRLPWPDGSFDGVVDNVSICSNGFQQCVKVVDEVRRVLKPGGLFLSCTFSDRTWGCGSGEEVEPGTYTNITEGPLAGKGLCSFFSREKAEELYVGFRQKAVETLAYTLDGMSRVIELWIVSCRK